MINYVGFIISFILGYFWCKKKEVIINRFKQYIFIIKNRKALKDPKNYNEFLEDFITNADYFGGNKLDK